MYKIYIDTTDRYKKVVKLIQYEVDVEECSGDIDIVATVKELLIKHNLTTAQIELYDVNPGPGSFTGIKIGVTIANVLNWALGKKSLSEAVMPEYGREPNITLKG